jgi:hypothetical protein
MKLPLPQQVAAQAEFIVNNLEQTDYSTPSRSTPIAGFTIVIATVSLGSFFSVPLRDDTTRIG